MIGIDRISDILEIYRFDRMDREFQLELIINDRLKN